MRKSEFDYYDPTRLHWFIHYHVIRHLRMPKRSLDNTSSANILQGSPITCNSSLPSQGTGKCGIQYPSLTHSIYGQKIIRNFGNPRYILIRTSVNLGLLFRVPKYEINLFSVTVGILPSTFIQVKNYPDFPLILGTILVNKRSQ